MRALRPTLDRPLHHVGMQFLKRVLVRAELHQRRHAECDALTGVANRRGFDLALAAAQARIHLPGVGSARVTFAWAEAPDDGLDPDSLMRAADERLMARKRARRRREALAAAA